MFRGRGRGGGGKVKREERGGGGRSQTRGEKKSVVGGSQAVKRTTSRSPGQSSPARARAAKAVRAASPKTKKAKPGPAAAKAEETPEPAGSAKTPVRKQKLPRVNDNPDAPEVVDVPNMRSSFIAIATPCENGTSHNGTTSASSPEKPSSEVTTEPSADTKVTFDSKMPLLAEEEKITGVSPAVNPAENGANNNEDFSPPPKQKESLQSPKKPDSLILIPLNDESVKGENLSDVKEVNGTIPGDENEESEEIITKDDKDTDEGDLPAPTDAEGDFLTKMIRENLNKAVNDSDDSFTADDTKLSLVNAIKNTLKKSSNSSRGKSDPTDTETEEVVANGSVTSHVDSDLDIDEDETEQKNPQELLETGDAGAEVEDNEKEVGDQKESELIAAAEVEISPEEPSEKNEAEPLKTSGDGINDLLSDAKSVDGPSSEIKADKAKSDGDAKVAIPLDQLEQGMMLVESVQIEQIEADGNTANDIEALELVDVPDNNIAVVLMDESAKPKLDIDKSALFSQMNDKFAKDTHAALKNRPVYQKRNRTEPIPSEVKQDKLTPVTSPNSPPAKKKKLKEKTKKLKKEKVEKEEKEEIDDIEEKEETVTTVTAVITQEEEPEESHREADSLELRNAEAEESHSEVDPELMRAEAAEKDEEEDNEEKQLPDLEPAVKPAMKPEDDSEAVPEETNLMEVDEDKKVEEESPIKSVQSPVEENVKNEEDNEICDTPESRVTPEDQENSTSSFSSREEVKSSSPPTIQPICDSPPASPSPNTPPKSELTKSLRKVRLAKKSPSKSSKETSWEEDASSDKSEKAEEDSSPSKDLSGPKAGTEVFDFTDDEDIPLSNIDLEVFEAGSSEGGQLMINIPEPQPTLDHELSKLPSTSKISPTKLASRKLDIVSPQILSASDAMAAVSALQLSPSSVTESGGDKYNGEVMSDDTDNSLKTPLTFSEKAKFAKRKKRRMQESDGGEGSQQPLQCCSVLNLISLQERRRMTWRIPRRTRDPRG